MIRLIIIIQSLLLLFAIKAIAQNLDSLENVLKTENLSTEEQLKLYNNLSWDYINADADKSKLLARQGIEICLKEKNDKMCGILYHHIGIACYNNGELDSALHYFQTAEIFSKKAKDDYRLNRIYIAYAILYDTENEYEKTIDLLLQLIPRLEKGNDGDLTRTAYGNLGTTYLNIHNYALAEKYYLICAEKSLEANDDWKLSQAYNGLMEIYFEKKDFEKSLEYAEKALVVSERCGDYECQALCYRKKSEISYIYFKDFDKSLEYALKGLAISRSRSNKSDVSEMLVNLSNINYQKGDYKESMKLAVEAMQTDTSDASVYEKIAVNIVKSGIQLNDKESAIKFLNKYLNIVETRSNSEIHKFGIDSEKKYQTEKKQSEIENLTLIKKQRTLVIYILIAALLLLLLFSYTYFRNIKNKKIIADQQLEIKEKQLLELEKERQLTAAKSVLQGEEAERTRLAGDLHDGLGGLLTGVKLNLSSMKENAIITSKNLEHFNRALDLLDTSINEMRRVAHNLMPETLVHYGLQTALHDYVKQITTHGEPKITFNTFGENFRYSQELEITTYRISQELITNAVKHASATQIDVQIFTEKERICVQVIDNGIGFDSEKHEISHSGRGLKNINDRVSAFNGRFEILSEPGKGTECTIEFFIT